MANITKETMTETEKTSANYEEIISALPKIKGCFDVDIRLYEGAYYGPSISGVVAMQREFKANPSDIFITSFPKSGFTWLKAMVFAIINRTRYKNEAHPLLTKISHDCVPILEISIYGNNDATPSPRVLDDMVEPRLLSTHVHYTSLPDSVTNSSCKVVYICRDPKDVFVSFWHFVPKTFPGIQQSSREKMLTSDFNLFCEGKCPFGPYWDHVLGYWKASIQNPENVLFLKYEDMKRDPQFYVRKIAQYLGQPFSSQEEESSEVQNIVDLCSFEHLSNLEANKTEKLDKKYKYDAFYRKGEVGDWKSHLSPQMADRLDEIIKQKLHGTRSHILIMPDRKSMM